MDRKYLMPWVSVDGVFNPASHALWGKWYAVDGRLDPEQAGGEGIVTLVDVPDAIHNEVIKLVGVTELTPANVRTTISAKISEDVIDTIEEAEQFFDLRTGTDLAAYPDKRARRNQFRTRKKRGTQEIAKARK